MGVIPFYNSWTHNNVTIKDDTIHNEMIINLPNGNRPITKMEFKNEEYLDLDGLYSRLDQLMSLPKFIYAILVLITCFSYPYLPSVFNLVLIILTIVGVVLHYRWYSKKMYEKYKYHFIKTKQIRDKDKEILEIEKLIKQYGN